MKKSISLLMLIIAFQIYGQQNTQKEINAIKTQIEQIKKLNESQQDKIVELQELKNTKSAYEQSAKEIKEISEIANKREEKFLDWIQAIILFVTFIGGVLGYFGIKNAKENIENSMKIQIADELKTLKEENLETISRLFEEEKWRMDLMKKSNVMVVNPKPGNDTKYLHSILRYFNYKETNNVEFSDLNAILNFINENKQPKKYNVLLLENSDANWFFTEKKIFDKDSDEIKKEKDLHNHIAKKNVLEATRIASNIPHDCMLVYFGPGDAGFFPSKYFQFAKKEDGSPRDKKEIREIVNRISFVNAPSKLYPNLIDALKYLDIINS